MTTEEKLKHFQEICMTDAREKSAKILDDYVNTLDKTYEEHTEDAKKRAKMQEEAETEKLGREREFHGDQRLSGPVGKTDRCSEKGCR